MSHWCNGNTTVSKTVDRGSIPWWGAIYNKEMLWEL